MASYARRASCTVKSCRTERRAARRPAPASGSAAALAKGASSRIMPRLVLVATRRRVSAAALAMVSPRVAGPASRSAGPIATALATKSSKR